jgi:glycosyltransferase involved in cell wall biosynthesis
MRILMLHNRYLVSGGEDHSSVAEVALLREHGHEVEFLEEDNRRIEQLGKLRTAVRTVWSAESHRAIHCKLKSGGFDVMHVQNFFPLWSPSVYYAASRNSVPVVQTLRNYRLLCVNSLLFRDQRVCEDCVGSWLPWHGVAHACYRGSRSASAAVAAMIGIHRLAGTWRRRVTTYIAVSEFARHKYIAGGFPADQIVVKPNFIYPSPELGSGGGGYAIYVGRLSPEKGIATLLEAWQSARDPVPLKMVGHGPLLELVTAASAACGSIEYLGSRTPAEVLELIRKAEFFVFPSAVYEGMPRTIIEAFAVGTPVIASNIGSSGFMVAPGETGFHFDPGDSAGLRERVEWCSRNLDRLRSLRGHARLAFEANYTGKANLEKLIEIYRQAGQKTRRGNQGETSAG